MYLRCVRRAHRRWRGKTLPRHFLIPACVLNIKFCFDYESTYSFRSLVTIQREKGRRDRGEINRSRYQKIEYRDVKNRDRIREICRQNKREGERKKQGKDINIFFGIKAKLSLKDLCVGLNYKYKLKRKKEKKLKI